MRANTPTYEMVTPTTLKEALSLLDQYRPFAGGTDIMVQFETGKLVHRRWMNILSLTELKGIEVTKTHIKIGALTTYSQLQTHPILQKEFPILCQSSRETGAYAIQNRGTIGGNLANASPAADSSPGLLVYNASLEIVGKDVRSVAYQNFHLGYKKMVLKSNELIKAIVLPRVEQLPTDFHYWKKVGTRKAQAISKLSIAALRQAGTLRIALGSVGPVPILCHKTAEAIMSHKSDSEIFAALQSEISPIDDIRSTRNYRLRVAENLLREIMI